MHDEHTPEPPTAPAWYGAAVPGLIAVLTAIVAYAGR